MITTMLVATAALKTPVLAPAFVKTRTFQGIRSIAVCGAQSGSRFAVSDEDSKVRIVDAASGNVLKTLAGHPQPAYGLAFSRDGKWLATGDETGRIFIWDTATGLKKVEFSRDKAHQRGIQALNFSSDGKTLASTGKDDAVILWDIASKKQIRKLLGEGANVASASFGTGGLFTATLGSGLIFNKSGAWNLAGKMDGHGGQGTVDVRLDPTGTRAISGGRDFSVAYWNLGARKRIARMTGHEDVVMNVAMAPNGSIGASSSTDRTVIIWNLAAGSKILKLDDQSAIGAPICFTGDGKFFISSNSGDQLTTYSVTPGVGGAAAKTSSKKRK